MQHVHEGAIAENSRGDFDWGSLTWLANGDIGNARKLAMAFVTIRKGERNPRHRHNSVEEILYLLSGELEHTVGDESYRIKAGDTITIPDGVFHNAVNHGDEDARMLVVYSGAERDFEAEEGDLEDEG